MKKIRTVLIVIMLMTPQYSFAGAEKESQISKLFSLNMKELADIKVTSVSKRIENASQAAAAIHVITQEDIRRLGATTLPEILRHVPGVQVSRTDSSRWRVSIRGFNAAFTNKLLVLIDGRSVYTPLFSGVYWDTQNPPIEDIQRIEVIRGSAGSTFGANAVNGIINVMTKKSSHTQGTLISTLAGNQEKGKGYVRHGGKIGTKGYYRLYAQYFSQDETQNLAGEGIGEDWDVSQLGFRTDYDVNTQNKVTLQGDAYQGTKSGLFLLPTLDSPYIEERTQDEDLLGGNLLTNWTHTHKDGEETIVKAYVDYTRREHITLDQKIFTADLDYQFNWNTGKTHEMTAGAGFRYIYDDLKGSAYNFYPNNRTDSNYVYSSFIQDKITLVPNRLLLTLGSKFEYNGYTDHEIQPTARMSLLLPHNQTIWAAFNRSVRTPSRAERDIRLVVANSQTKPGFITWNGNRALESEELQSIEVGYKSTPYEDVSFDITGFYNQYDKLRTFEAGPNINPDNNVPNFPAHKNTPLTAANKGYGEVFGIETSVNWNILKSWSLQANYSFLTMDLHIDPDSNDSPQFEKDEGRTAQNNFNLLSRIELPHDIEFDQNIYYTDNLPAIGIQSYIRTDARIGWQPKDGVELSLIGQNLFDNRHSETSNPQFGQQSEIGRSIYVKITVKF